MMAPSSVRTTVYHRPYTDDDSVVCMDDGNY